MRAPLHGRREDARRLAARLRELALGASRQAQEERRAAPPPPVPEPEPSAASPDRAADAATRLDAARRRLRSSITAREDEDGDEETVRYR